MKLVARTQGDANLVVPLNWVDRTVVRYAAPTDEQGRRANVVAMVRAHPGNLTLEVWAQRQIAQLQQVLRDFTLIEHGPIPMSNRCERYRVSYTFTQGHNDLGVLLRQDQWYMLRNGKLLTVTTTTSASDYDLHATLLRQIVDGSELLDR